MIKLKDVIDQQIKKFKSMLPMLVKLTNTEIGKVSFNKKCLGVSKKDLDNNILTYSWGKYQNEQKQQDEDFNKLGNIITKIKGRAFWPKGFVIINKKDDNYIYIEVKEK